MRAKTKVRICAVVKADAYGHGAIAMAKSAEKFADELAVADMREAGELVEAGVRLPINVLGSTVDGSSSRWPMAGGLFREDEIISVYEPRTPNPEPRSIIIPTVCDIADIKTLQSLTSTPYPIIPNTVNLKINTGMNRLGVRPGEVKEAVRRIKSAGFTLKSVFSHLYNATDEKEAKIQLDLFKESAAFLSPHVTRHLAASSAMALPGCFCFDMVRPGLALYGYGNYGTEPVMKVRATILKIFRVQKGEHVSYGDYTAPRDMTVAVLGTGYADGLRRKTNPNLEDRLVSVHNVLCPTVGQTCMDLTMVDVSGIPAKRGDYAYLIGKGASGEALAAACNTNMYEILTGFKGRVTRNYVW